MKKIAVIAPTAENWGRFENSIECDRIYERIEAILKDHAHSGTVCLMTSMNIGVETLAATAALALGRDHAVCLECVIPYEGQANDWAESDRDRYFDIIEKCDKETLLQTRYSSSAEENCLYYTVDSAEEIITFGELPLKARTIIAQSGKKIIKL